MPGHTSAQGDWMPQLAAAKSEAVETLPVLVKPCRY
jgi:hypothetical protein